VFRRACLCVRSRVRARACARRPACATDLGRLACCTGGRYVTRLRESILFITIYVTHGRQVRDAARAARVRVAVAVPHLLHQPGLGPARNGAWGSPGGGGRGVAGSTSARRRHGVAHGRARARFTPVRSLSIPTPSFAPAPPLALISHRAVVWGSLAERIMRKLPNH
jgi:hypothetical protein